MLHVSMARQSPAAPAPSEDPSDLRDWVERARRGDSWGAEMLYRAHLVDVNERITRALDATYERRD